MSPYPKRLIEVDLPIKRISAHARREKSIRHGHISTLHIWWARRPLAACRAVICAALWPDPADELCPESFRDVGRAQMQAWAGKYRHLLGPESMPRFIELNKEPHKLNEHLVLRQALLDFIADFANWDNSTVKEYLVTSRALTQAAHEALGGVPGTRPLVVDPFAGGGSIPLEALRVGADAFASDLNPIPVLLNKVVLEYIPKYGQRLVDEVRKRSEVVGKRAIEELSRYYVSNDFEQQPQAFIWFKTIVSEEPVGGRLPVEVPLVRSMWLSKASSRKQAFRWVRDKQGKVVTRPKDITYADGTKMRVGEPILEIFSPKGSKTDEGTSKGGAATCPVTDYTTPVESVRKQLSKRTGGSADARLACIVSSAKGSNKREYRLPVSDDYRRFQDACAALNRLVKQSGKSDPLLPDGEINHLRGFFNVVLYGMRRWGDLFSGRQALALATLARLIQEESAKVAKEEGSDFAAAVQTCLGMALGRLVDYGSNLCVWASTGEFVCHTFGRQALPMVWDFAEVNPLSDTGWRGANEWVRRVIEAIQQSSLLPGVAIQASALKHPLPSEGADALVTDPPYYAAIPYADLSDFFYGWLKRSVGNVHDSLFREELAPKEDECVALSHRAAMYRHKDAAWFEARMTEACHEGRRLTKPSGIGLFVFANKETAGWEAMLNALISGHWVITASWPIDTERGGRLRARNSAALASSVHLVCRPRENPDGSVRSDQVGDWRDVLVELPRRIHEWMPRLAEEGVVGADAIFACLGPALEVFSRYSRVEKASGETVALKEYLEQVWAAVAKEALTLVFEGADTTGFEPDARLTAMWLWTLNAGATDANNGESDEDEESDEGTEGAGAKKAKTTGFVLEYDAARKIAQGLGAHLEALTSLVEVKGDKARLLPVGERTKALFGKDESGPATKKGKKNAKQQMAFGFQAELEAVEEEQGWGVTGAPQAGQTVLDRIHQSMILFAAGRGEAMKRFLAEEGAGRDERFWRLAQALSALYPSSTDEKRWVDGVLARKKGLGL